MGNIQVPVNSCVSNYLNVNNIWDDSAYLCLGNNLQVGEQKCTSFEESPYVSINADIELTASTDRLRMFWQDWNETSSSWANENQESFWNLIHDGRSSSEDTINLDIAVTEGAKYKVQILSHYTTPPEYVTVVEEQSLTNGALINTNDYLDDEVHNFSYCLHLKPDPNEADTDLTLMSWASPTNDIYLRLSNPAALTIQLGSEVLYTDIDLFDVTNEYWAHLCVTFDSSIGELKIYREVDLVHTESDWNVGMYIPTGGTIATHHTQGSLSAELSYVGKQGYQYLYQRCISLSEVLSTLSSFFASNPTTDYVFNHRTVLALTDPAEHVGILDAGFLPYFMATIVRYDVSIDGITIIDSDFTFRCNFATGVHMLEDKVMATSSTMSVVMKQADPELYQGISPPSPVEASPLVSAVLVTTVTCAPTRVTNSDKSEEGAVTGRLFEVVEVQCDEYYYGSGNMTCEKNGSFSWLSCQGNPCTATSVANSNLATERSIIGGYEDSVTIVCDSGYSGGGVMTCLEAGVFTNVTCSANQCASSEVAHSDHATNGSITGFTGDTIAISCESGYFGSGSVTCQTDGTFDQLICTDQAPTEAPTTAPTSSVSGTFSSANSILETSSMLFWSAARSRNLEVATVICLIVSIVVF